MKVPTRYDDLLKAVKALVDAERASLLAAQRRHELPPGSSRARVTTANANHARKAEARDRKLDAAAAEAARVFHLMPRS